MPRYRDAIYVIVRIGVFFYFLFSFSSPPPLSLSLSLERTRKSQLTFIGAIIYRNTLEYFETGTFDRISWLKDVSRERYICMIAYRRRLSHNDVNYSDSETIGMFSIDFVTA